MRQPILIGWSGILSQQYQIITCCPRRCQVARLPMAELLRRNLHDRRSVTAKDRDTTIARTGVDSDDLHHGRVSPLVLHRCEEFVQVPPAVFYRDEDRNAGQLSHR